MPFDWALPSSWQWATIEQIQAPIARPIVTGPFGSSIGSRFFVGEGVPVIRGNNLSVARIRFIDDGFVYLTEEKAAEFKNLEAHPGDLVFTAAGTIGQVGIIPEKPRFQRYIISNKQMRARLDTALVEPLFAYYWFTEPYMREHIISRNTGSTIPLINLSVLRSLPIPLPPLETQHEIVQVLGVLDDKIALLRETNVTLEAIAQALFKSWFVDFDPVRAKAEGREPEGVPSEVADLFPSEFEDSELGVIPKGWRVGTLQDLLVLQRGFDLPAQARTLGDYPIIAASSLSDLPLRAGKISPSHPNRRPWPASYRSTETASTSFRPRSKTGCLNTTWRATSPTWSRASTLARSSALTRGAAATPTTPPA